MGMDFVLYLIQVVMPGLFESAVALIVKQSLTETGHERWRWTIEAREKIQACKVRISITNFDSRQSSEQ